MKPLFVVGAPRSGTTLVRNLLRSLSDVYLLPDEFQILKRFIQAVEASQDPKMIAEMLDGSTFAMHMRRRGFWPNRDDLTALLANKPASEAFRDLVVAIANLEGVGTVRWWGDKTPETVFELDLVARIWPDVQILYVQRDPRATVMSMHKSWGRSLTRSAMIWRDAIRAAHIFKAQFPEQYRLVEFETLTEEPATQLAALSTWLDVSFEPEKLKNVTSEERWGSAAGSTGIVKRAPDWQQNLTQSQIRLIEEICFDEMRTCGIEPLYATQVRTPSKQTERLLKLNDAIRVLQSYARERGWRQAIAYKINQWRNSVS
ncbi:MAG: sulfotransferase [Pseudomonadota bacterium]